MQVVGENNWIKLWEIDTTEKFLKNDISFSHSKKYHLPRFSYELNNGRNILKDYLKKTDSRFRKDIINYENGNLEKSSNVNVELVVNNNNNILIPVYFQKKENISGVNYEFIE